MFRLIVFDLDGTLIDSRRDIAESANTLLVAHGVEPLAEDRIGRMVGGGAALLVSRAFDAASLTQPADALEQYLEIYGRRLLEHTRPYPGIPDALERLRTRASLAVLTNKPLRHTWQILEGLGLSRHFAQEAVVGGDGPWPRKPDPAGLLHLAARAGVDAPATVLVGDSLTDWRTAHAATTRVCLARYGFGYETFPPGTLDADDLAADAPVDLVRLL